MKRLRQLALGMLLAVFVTSLLANFIAPASYATQFRDSPNVGSSWKFPLGTDELGRDRFSRLIYGTRVSLLLGPAAALLSTLIAAVIGGAAGYIGGSTEQLAMSATDLVLSLPWFFLLLTARAMLPLNAGAWSSVIITFALLGLLGWPATARVACAGAKSLRESDVILQARASGCHGLRLVMVHVVPNLAPTLFAQFWILIPVFIIGEANLGILGLGVAEPLPSWGNLLRELGDSTVIMSNPWSLAPAALLLLVMSCFQITLSRKEHSV
jgi:peptide/nickel transport system permease protein